jgi:hypothetical protein
LLLNNSKLNDFIDRIYPIELEIKVTTDTTRSASYLDLHLELLRDICRCCWNVATYKWKVNNGKTHLFCGEVSFLTAQLRDTCRCCWNVATYKPTYISQLIRYSSACGPNHAFLNRGLLQTKKLLNNGFLVVNF